MSSKREEERNEKIIRGLLKLPPNRRCINCNSLGPQYVCISFWTFICITCSGIHREFTHRVKSVSMAKFTSEEVDALQKGGNQRARELFLKAWDLQRNRLPDNSNIDKIREFIKNVYVEKRYSTEKSSDRPPRDPQSLRIHEDETRRASSYHSYSQSPPYDFQYEERRYGKHAPALTRKPGSDRGLYEGKLASFLSSTFLSYRANNGRFGNEGSPNSQRDTGSPFSQSSTDISGEVPQLHTVQHNSDIISRSDGGKILHPQRTASSGSFGSFDSSSVSSQPVNLLGVPEISSQPEQSTEVFHENFPSFPSLPQSPPSSNFDGLDLFSTPFAPQSVTSTPPTDTNSKLLQSSWDPSINIVQSSQITVPSSSLDLFTVFSSDQQPNGLSDGKVSEPNNGGWATFDNMPQNAVPVGTENSAPTVVPSSDGNVLGSFNPFSIDQSYSNQDFTGPGPLTIRTFGPESLQHVESTLNNTQNILQLWNAFDDSAGEKPVQNVVESTKQTAASSLGFGVYEAFSNDDNVRTPNESGPTFSSLSSYFSNPLDDFPMVSTVDDVHSFATGHTRTNPFDLPYDSDMESNNMLWNMSSLQAALPNTQMPASFAGGVNQSWFPQNSVPSYVPAEVSFDSGSLGFIAGQAPNTQISNIYAQGPVASVGGNPFA